MSSSSCCGLSYRPITADSNLEPLQFEVRRDGQLVELGVGAFGTITIKDERTGTRFVTDAAVTITEPGVASYVLPDSIVAKITREGTWIVEWLIISAAGRKLRSEPIRLPVRPKI